MTWDFNNKNEQDTYFDYIAKLEQKLHTLLKQENYPESRENEEFLAIKINNNNTQEIEQKSKEARQKQIHGYFLVYQGKEKQIIAHYFVTQKHKRKQAIFK